MKKYLFCHFIILFIIILNITSCSKTEPSHKETALEHAKKYLDPAYVCPMHPSIVRHKVGHCPICGMQLVKKNIQKTASNERKIKITGYPVVHLTYDIIQKLGVRTLKIKYQHMEKLIKTVGYVNYDEDSLTTISVKTAGWVENLSVRRVGLPVYKGQLMLELYSPEFLDVQKEFIATQKKDHSGNLRKYGDRKESVNSRDHLRYMSVPESMMNEIARRGKVKHRLPIYSPMQGLVVEHYIHKNQFIDIDEPMMVIADMSSVWVEANIYEYQLQWIKLGLLADIEVRSLPGKHFTGQLTYIHPELNYRTRTLKVRLLVPNPNWLLRPNMFAEVRIKNKLQQKIIAVPREALIITGTRKSIILSLGNGKFLPKDVVTGLHSEGKVEILSGLKKGDRIVLSGQFLIDSEANLQASFNRLHAD